MPSVEQITQRNSRISVNEEGEISTDSLIDLHTPLTEEDLKDPERMRQLVEQGQILAIWRYNMDKYWVTVLPIPASLVERVSQPFADVDPTIVIFHAEGKSYEPYQFRVSREVGLAILRQQRNARLKKQVQQMVAGIKDTASSLLGKKKK